jgi:hypothetical protein
MLDCGKITWIIALIFNKMMIAAEVERWIKKNWNDIRKIVLNKYKKK